MSIPALRAKQTSTTTGTGTLTLLAAASNVRSFQAAFGSSSVDVRYVISGSTFYEIGIGTFNGGSPGTLSRDTILASSNAGSAVSLPAGTHDVFAWIDVGDRVLMETSSTTVNLALADLGNQVVYLGASAATVNLPAVATVPLGASYAVRNSSLVNVTLDGSGSETIDGYTTRTVLPGQSCDVVRYSGGWITRGLYGPATPNGVAGFIGEWRSFSSTDGGNLDLPAGGTWHYFAFRVITTTSAVDGTITASGAAGGSTVIAGVANRTWLGFCWRIA